MEEASCAGMDDDSLLRDSFDLESVDVSNVATAFLQEAIQEEHPHLLNAGQHNILDTSRSTNSSINCGQYSLLGFADANLFLCCMQPVETHVPGCRFVANGGVVFRVNAFGRAPANGSSQRATGGI